jgi:hypothetical protein
VFDAIGTFGASIEERNEVTGRVVGHYAAIGTSSIKVKKIGDTALQRLGNHARHLEE